MDEIEAKLKANTAYTMNYNMKTTSTSIEDVVIIDNVLPPHVFERFKEAVFESETWKYVPLTSYECIKGGGQHEWNTHFSSMVYAQATPQNALWEACFDLFDTIHLGVPIRIKANMNMPAGEQVEQSWHCDFYPAPQGARTGIFYFNTTNGPTLVELSNGDIIEVGCVENRFVSFPAETLHTGRTFTEGKVRCVLNLNYIEVPEGARQPPQYPQ